MVWGSVNVHTIVVSPGDVPPTPPPIERSTRVRYTEASGITPREQTFDIEGELTQDSIPNRTSIEEIEIGGAVTKIDYAAFYICKGITSVVIPDSVTSIGAYAFFHCDELASVAIPDRVTIIGSFAFAYCIGLTNVTIGNSVTNIWANSFNGCTALASVVFDGDEPALGADAFANVASGCKAYVDGSLPGWSQHPDGSDWNGLTIVYKS